MLMINLVRIEIVKQFQCKWTYQRFCEYAKKKLNFSGKLLFKNEGFQYHDPKFNFNQFWREFGILHIL